jgi:hypothetical protein
MNIWAMRALWLDSRFLDLFAVDASFRSKTVALAQEREDEIWGQTSFSSVS